MLSYLVAFNKEILLDRRITNAIQFATSIKQWRVPLLTLLLPFLKYAHWVELIPDKYFLSLCNFNFTIYFFNFFDKKYCLLFIDTYVFHKRVGKGM